MKKVFSTLIVILTLFGAASAQEKVQNVIFMIGDGMGLAQVSALMIENGYRPTAFDRAQSVALAKTYSANNRVTDSAASGTALATGVKTRNKTLGVDPEGAPVRSILKKAEERGLATGLVVTSDIVHATPGAFYAHVDNRSKYEEIALQLSDEDINVLFGGGMGYFSKRKDGQNLVKKMQAKGYTVTDRWEEVEGLSKGKVAGLFREFGHLLPIVEGRDSLYLAKATGKALEILSNDNPEGFFLMVEGSQIDFEGHDNDLPALLAEMRDFDRAVTVAFDYADQHPGTLVVVTADHETGGLSIASRSDDFTAAESGLSYRFGTEDHSGTLVPVYAYGTEAGQFRGVMENIDINRLLTRLLLGE